MIRRIVKYTLRVLAILLGLVVLLVVALYLPPVQDFIKGKAVVYVSDHFGMKLSVERLRLKFPLRLAIDNAEAITNAGDTLFSCGTLRADVALLPLLRGEVTVRQFTFGEASFHLADTVGGLDLQVRVRKFALRADQVDLAGQTAHVPWIELTGGRVGLSLGVARPDTVAIDTTVSVPLRWKITAEKLSLNDIAFTMHTSPAVSDLIARLATGDIRNCTVDIGRQTVTAASVMLEKGDYSYFADTAAVVSAAIPDISVPKNTVSGLPWTVRLTEVRLTDNMGRYGLPYGTPGEGLDLHHIAVSGLNLSLDSVFNRGGEIRAMLRDLTLTERSGLEVTQAHGGIAMDSTGYSLRDFALHTHASTVSAGIFCGAGIAKMDPMTRIDADLSVQLGTSDIFRIVGMDEAVQRKFTGRVLTLDSRLTGTLGDLDLQKLAVALPNVFSLNAEGRALSVTDPERTSGRITFNANLRNPDFVLALLPKSTVQEISLPALQFRGEARAAAGSYSTKMSLTAAGGRVGVNGSFSPKNERYRAEISVDSLPLDRFIPSDSLGRVTLTLDAEGRGFDFFSPKTTATVHLQIEQAEYHRFDYRDVELNAGLEDNRLTGSLRSDNDALRLNLELSGLLTRQRQEANINGVISALDLRQMNFVKEPAAASLRLDLSASAATGGAYALHASLDSLKLHYGTLESRVLHTVVDASADSSRVSAEVTSGDLKLNFQSSVPIDSLGSGLARAIHVIQGQIIAGRIDTDTLERILPPFRLDFSAGRNNILNNYLHTQGMGFGSVMLAAAANQGEPFGLKAEVNQFSTQGLVLDTLTTGIGGRNGELQYYVRLANKPGNLNRMGMIALYGRAAGNSGEVSLAQFDRNRRVGLNFGLRATLGDSCVTVNLIPEHPIFGFSEWSVNEGNYFRYGFDRRMAADIRVTRAGQQFSLQSVSREDLPQDSVRLTLAGINIGNALSVLPTAPPLGGTLGADLMFGMADSTLAARGMLNVDTLRYNSRTVGDVGLNLAYRLDSLSTQEGSLALLLNRKTALSVTGRYAPRDSTGLQLTADIPGIPLAAANPFLPAGSGSLAGLLKGRIEAGGNMEALKLSGSLKFDSTFVDVAAIGTRFGITDSPIVLATDKVLFKDFGLIAPNKQRLTVNGELNVAEFSKITADLAVRANDFQLINVPRSKGSMVFGKAGADISARVQGPLDMLNIRGDISLLTGTEVTYVMQDSPMSLQYKQQNVVTFMPFNDTMTVYTARPPSMLRLGGVDMLMNVAIDPEVQVAVYLSDDGQNRINLKGGGNLTYSMNRLGDTRFAGKYELSGGQVRYNPPVISAKDFTITPGGYVVWTGEMADPSFSIRAVEKVRTTVTMEDQQSRAVNFEISINIKGSLNDLSVTFDLGASEDLTLQNQLASLTPEQRQNQAMGLLIYNSYSGPGTSAKVNAGNPLNSFITKELNQWAQNSLKGVDLSFGIDSYDDAAAGADGTRTDYSYKLSKKFFNNRIKAVVGGKVSAGGDPNQSAAENLIDDISLEYQLTRRDNMYLKVFRETNFESILEGEVTETGVGFGVRKKISRLGDLFKLTKEKKEVKAERKVERIQKRKQKREDKAKTKAAQVATKTEEAEAQTEE